MGRAGYLLWMAWNAVKQGARSVLLRLQRWLMAGVLTGLAMRLALEKRPA